MTVMAGADDRLGSNAVLRFAAGMGSTALAQILAAASSILLVPLFIGAWGADTYGHWVALTALISYLTLIDLGGQNHVGNVLTMAYSRNDPEAFVEALSEGGSLFAAIAFVGFAVLGVICLAALAVPSVAPADVFIVLCLGTSLLLSMPSGVYVTAYRATGRYVRGTMLGNVLRLVSFLAMAGALLIRIGPASYAAVTLVLTVFVAVVTMTDARRTVPMFNRAQLSLRHVWEGRRHLNSSLAYWVLALAYAINFQGVVVVLAQFAPSEAVTLFATHRTMTGVIGYASSLLQSPLWPELTSLHARGRTEQLAHLAQLTIKTMGVISTIGALAIWIIAPLVYPVWTRYRLELSPLLLVILLTQAVLAAAWNTSVWAMLASNHQRQLAPWALGNAVVTIALAMMWAPAHGVLGVAAATLLGDVIFGLAVYPRLAGGFLRVPPRRLYGDVARVALLAAGGSTLMWYVVPRFAGAALPAGIVALALVAAVAVPLVIGMEDARWLWGRVRHRA